ncbi:MAG: YbaK/EbsC family protein [candidate division Zixibacteria bacterium]|nr:YbaK/EbsC family protein [candidate division Zixibacteria bacterium]
MPAKKLMAFLDENSVEYVIITHSEAYTAQKVAESAHVPKKEMAKTVIIRVDGETSMAVVPSSCKVDFAMLKKTIDANTVELATELEFEDMFPDCDLGAMPPFGNLYDMKVFVAEKLAEDEYIAFNACTHRELVKLAYVDFERLVKPNILKFACE